MLEDRDEADLAQRVRAGVLEQGTMDTLRAAGLGERMDRQGALHEGIELRYDGQGHRNAFQAHSPVNRRYLIRQHRPAQVVMNCHRARCGDGVGGPSSRSAPASRSP